MKSNLVYMNEFISKKKKCKQEYTHIDLRSIISDMVILTNELKDSNVDLKNIKATIDIILDKICDDYEIIEITLNKKR